MSRAGLLDGILETGAFVCDTAPAIFRFERSGSHTARAAIDELFDRVVAGTLDCLVPSVCAAELLVRPHRLGAAAVVVADGFLRGPNVHVLAPGLTIAHGAARLLARRVVGRLPDALVAATAHEAQAPLVTADRRLARAVPGSVLLR
jgi:predicted nucleic acid-binding protein